MTLIFSVHYFLWYGALTSIFGYESVYARYYTNATPMQYGYLNMILPFMTVLATPVICSMADRQRSHRSYFTISLVCATMSMCLYAMMPLFGDKRPQVANRASAGLFMGPWIYYCLNSLVCDLARGINTCLSDSFAVLQAEERGSSFGRIIVWGTFGWACSAIILSVINQASFMPRLVPGLLFGSVLLTIDVVIVSFCSQSTDFKLDIIPISAAQTLTGSASLAHKDPSDYQPMNESARINLGSDYDFKSGCRQIKTRSPVQIAMTNREIRRQAEATVQRGQEQQQEDETNLSRSTTNESEMDGSLKTINSDYISPGEGKSVVSSTAAVSPYKQYYETGPKMVPASKQLKETGERNSTQAAAAKKESSASSRKATSFSMQFVLLGLIMRRRRSLIRYLILFSLSGFFMSTHWNYFFLYLEKIYRDKFELISALSMVGQSILGELPFFILSRKVIDYCGRSHTLSISVISIGIRFLLYAYLLPNVNMYCIVIADCFQGPNYGLFYVIMTEVGLEYSFCDEETIERLANRGYLNRNNRLQVDSLRLSLRSTVQSVAFACYEGIGVGFGSLAGGWIVAAYGFKTLWLSMAACSISVGLINFLIEFTCREHDPELDQSEQSEFIRASRMGALRKLASPVTLPPAPTPGAPQAADARAPIAQSPLKLSLASKAVQLMLVRKSAGSRVAPPVALTDKQSS